MRSASIQTLPSCSGDTVRPLHGTHFLVAVLLLLCSLPSAIWGQQSSFLQQRKEMVENQVRARNITQADIVSAMETVPRHLFMPETVRSEAYADKPISIGWGQTISQPYLVALMTELLELDKKDRVLEIGTGSGYHAAVLSQVAHSVYSIEIIDELATYAQESLKDLGYDNVYVRAGDGYKGWPEEAPFDAIILTAAPPKIPEPLLDQLKVGGRLVVPLGVYFQDLKVITKTETGTETRKITPVRFVSMTGEIQEK